MQRCIWLSVILRMEKNYIKTVKIYCSALFLTIPHVVDILSTKVLMFKAH